ncbi:MAG: sulfurtransferase TusA family protein [Parvularcula sp.]|jgi:tRNA 2-thiouridine synthesizing protein A|nr:sulfurtransferase TusA family protein [Parvularcula sp.]
MTRSLAPKQTELDLRGLRCPIPVIRLESAMRRLASDESILVFADDPLARIDLPHAAHTAGMRCEPVESADSRAFAFRIMLPAR